MRVTIEHREEAAGVLGAKRNYFVDTTVDFSEEERAIIKARSLYDHSIPTGMSAPPTYSVVPGLLRAAAPLAGFVGLLIGLASPFTGWGSTLAGYLIVMAIGFWVFGFLYDRRKVKDFTKDSTRVRDMISNRRFSIYASSPAEAKAVDAGLRENLTNLKALIAGSAEVGGKQTFEL